MVLPRLLSHLGCQLHSPLKVIFNNKRHVGGNPLFKSSYHSYSIKKAGLKNFAIFTGKHLCWSLFLIKLLRTSILKNICEQLLQAFQKLSSPPLRKSVRFGVILVRIFLHSSHIIPVFSPNGRKIRTKITPNTDTFHAMHWKCNLR